MVLDTIALCSNWLQSPQKAGDNDIKGIPPLLNLISCNYIAAEIHYGFLIAGYQIFLVCCIEDCTASYEQMQSHVYHRRKLTRHSHTGLKNWSVCTANCAQVAPRFYWSLVTFLRPLATGLTQCPLLLWPPPGQAIPLLWDCQSLVQSLTF